MSEVLKRAIEEASSEELVLIADLTKRRRAVRSDHKLHERLCAQDFLKPFEDIIRTISSINRFGITFTFHGVPYEASFEPAGVYNRAPATASFRKCGDEGCHRGKTQSTAKSVTIDLDDLPAAEYVTEFVSMMTAFAAPSFISIILGPRSE